MDLRGGTPSTKEAKGGMSPGALGGPPARYAGLGPDDARRAAAALRELRALGIRAVADTDADAAALDAAAPSSTPCPQLRPSTPDRPRSVPPGGGSSEKQPTRAGKLPPLSLSIASTPPQAGCTGGSSSIRQQSPTQLSPVSVNGASPQHSSSGNNAPMLGLTMNTKEASQKGVRFGVTIDTTSSTVTDNGLPKLRSPAKKDSRRRERREAEVDELVQSLRIHLLDVSENMYTSVYQWLCQQPQFWETLGADGDSVEAQSLAQTLMTSLRMDARTEMARANECEEVVGMMDSVLEKSALGRSMVLGGDSIIGRPQVQDTDGEESDEADSPKPRSGQQPAPELNLEPSPEEEDARLQVQGVVHVCKVLAQTLTRYSVGATKTEIQLDVADKCDMGFGLVCKVFHMLDDGELDGGDALRGLLNFRQYPVGGSHDSYRQMSTKKRVLMQASICMKRDDHFYHKGRHFEVFVNIIGNQAYRDTGNGEARGKTRFDFFHVITAQGHSKNAGSSAKHKELMGQNACQRADSLSEAMHKFKVCLVRVTEHLVHNVIHAEFMEEVERTVMEEEPATSPCGHLTSTGTVGSFRKQKLLASQNGADGPPRTPKGTLLAASPSKGVGLLFSGCDDDDSPRGKMEAEQGTKKESSSRLQVAAG